MTPQELKRQRNILKLAHKFAPREWKEQHPETLKEFLAQHAKSVQPRQPHKPKTLAFSAATKNGERIARTIEECAKMGPEAEVLGGLMS